MLGDTDSAKTNLAFFLLNTYKGERDIYLLGYPKKIKHFKAISSFSDLFKLTDSIIFCDELQKFIKVYDRKANIELMDLISLFEHQNNTLIFTTQLSQFITKGVEGFIDCWLLTRLCDLKALKNGSKPRRVVQNTIHPKCTRWSLSLENGEYLEYSERNGVGINGVKTFPFQHIGKHWRNKPEKNGTKNPDNILKILESPLKAKGNGVNDGLEKKTDKNT